MQGVRGEDVQDELQGEGEGDPGHCAGVRKVRIIRKVLTRVGSTVFSELGFDFKHLCPVIKRLTMFK